MFAPIGTVVVVLREAVADDHQYLERRTAPFELGRGVAHRRSHAGGAFGLHLGDGVEDAVVEGIVEFLGDEELDAVASVAGKAVHPVSVAEALEGGTEQQGRLAEDVDDAPLLGFLGHPRRKVVVLVLVEERSLMS